MNEKKYDAIVIGSGIGGMACASALSKFGYKVLVIEQHYVAGGMTHTFKRKGFLWDVGVHVLGQMEKSKGPGKVINWLSEGNLEMASLGENYENFNFPDDFKISFPDSREKFIKTLKEKFPNETDAIDKYFQYVYQAVSAGKMHFLARNMPLWVEKIMDKTLLKKFNHWSKKTTKEVLDSITNDEKLKSTLVSQWGYYGLPPSESSFFIHALIVRHFWGGGYYPVGSSKNMADTILKSVKENGGEVLLRTEVKDIIMNGNKAVGVETVKGDKFFADKIISGIGARATAERLIPHSYQQKSWVKDIKKIGQTPCHICLYLGFEGDIVSAGATKGNQWFFNTWDMENTYWDINNPDTKADVLFCSFPSLKDPEHEPGEKIKNTGEVVTFVPYDYFKKWEDSKRGKRPEDYEALKKDIEERLLKQLHETMPEIMKHCVFHELSTPLSTTHYCKSPAGAIYGMNPTPERFSTKALRPQTPIKNFYLTGSDVGTLGVIGAMMGGVLTAAKIEKKVYPHIT